MKKFNPIDKLSDLKKEINTIYNEQIDSINLMEILRFKIKNTDCGKSKMKRLVWTMKNKPRLDQLK